MSALVSLSADALRAITGGATNKDGSSSVLGGIAYSKDYSQRSDQAYRLDAIKAACTQANTDWFWGTDQQKTGQCILDHLDPKPAPAAAKPGS